MSKIADIGKSKEACSFDDTMLLHRLEKESHPLQIIFMAAFSPPPSPMLRHC